jgi:hypothetical protein
MTSAAVRREIEALMLDDAEVHRFFSPRVAKDAARQCDYQKPLR